jgi:predicted nucleic acid-binding protein
LIDDVGRGPVAIDSAVFIYWIEGSLEALPVIRPVFEAIDAGDLVAVTSAITLLEVLVVPYRAGNSALAQRYEALLCRSRGLALVELTLAQLRLASRLRAELGLRTPDALQVAGGLAKGCSAFLTNDLRLPAAIRQMKVLKLRDYVPGS